MALGLALVAATLVITPWGREQLRLSFSRESDALLELYLLDPGAAADCPTPLPTSVPTPSATGRAVSVPRYAAQTVAFGAANRSSAALEIVWRATMRSGGTTRTVGRDRLSIPAGGRSTASLQFTPPAAGYVVDITLDSAPQRLRLTCPRLP